MTDTLRDVLGRKGDAVVTAHLRDTVRHAVTLMDAHSVGSVLVMGGPNLLGIITERETLRRMVYERRSADVATLAEVMNPSPLCAESHTSVRDAIALVTAKRVRHLVVRDAERVLGVVSIGDLLHRCARQLEREVDNLASFIHGPCVSSPPGAPYLRADPFR